MMTVLIYRVFTIGKVVPDRIGQIFKLVLLGPIFDGAFVLSMLANDFLQEHYIAFARA